MGRRQKKPRKLARAKPVQGRAGYLVWIVRQVATEKRRPAPIELLETITPCSLPRRSAMLVAEGFNRAIRDAHPELLAMAIPADWKSPGRSRAGPANSQPGA
jgi:hypothetical protein